jgi:hypothetical protein
MNRCRIDFLDRSHNSEILSILRLSPITTDNITLCFDRQPDFFLLPEIKYFRYDCLGFFVDEKLSGFVLKGYHNALVNGKPEIVFHFTDYYILPGARGKWFNYEISKYLFDRRFNNSGIGYAIIMEGNKEALSLVGRRHPRFPDVPWTRIINKLEVKTIMITWPLKLSTHYSIRHAEKKDIPSIVSLLNEEHKDRLFGLTFSESSFENHLSDRPGIALGNYYLAEDKNANVCGVCAAWDCTSFKQNRVLNYGIRFLPALLTYKFLSLLFGFSPLPEKGDIFRDINITDYAVKNRDPQIMKALLRAIYSDCRKSGYQSIIWGCTAGDPLLKACNGFFSQSVISNIVLMSTQPELIEDNSVEKRLPYIDVACL